MASKPLVLHRLAEGEAKATARWYHRRDPRGAERFADAVEQAFVTLGHQPELFPPDAFARSPASRVWFPICGGVLRIAEHLDGRGGHARKAQAQILAETDNTFPTGAD